MTNLLVALLAAVLGGVVGAVVAASRWRHRFEEAATRKQALTEPSSSDVEMQLEHLRAALQVLPLGVVVVDGDGAELLRTGQADRVLGVLHLDVLVADAVDAHVSDALAGASRESTLEVYGPPRRTLRLCGSPVRLPDDTMAALVTIEDITERVRLDAARTDLVANLTHELKTPVGGLSLLAEALAEEDEPEVVRQLAPRLVSEAHRLSRLVDELLELSRIELGGLGQPEVVAVEAVLHDAGERVRPLAGGHRLEIFPPAQPAELAGNRRQIVSALGNLVENAIAYSDPGSVVEVEAVVDGAWVELVVRDRGIGIPERDLDRIFERFYRVDRARSRATGGTGLGLSIVRHVAANHGGTVTVQSHEGEGSTFTLRLPRVGAGLTHLAEAG
jgi:two-component system sensor histidine kinase SenX3